MPSEIQSLEDEGRSTRWKRFLHNEEAKVQISLALPLIVVNVSYYLIVLVSLMFAGRQGTLELAGATLANSWSTVTGISFLIGLTGALETLCGQSFGSKQYRLLGVQLQTSCIITTFFCVIISVIWFFTEAILVFFHQAPDIAKASGLYLKCFVPGMFAYGLIQNFIRFLQMQSFVNVLMIASVCSLIFHVPVCFLMVDVFKLGFIGAPLAASVSFWGSAIVLGLYIVFSKRFKKTWLGFSLESFVFIWPTVKIALPSAGMVCLEYCAFEIMVLLAGLLPNSEITTSIIAICVNTEAIAYMIVCGLSAAISTRVSNEVGANSPHVAKRALFVSIVLALLCALIIDLSLLLGHNQFSGLFTTDDQIKTQFAYMTPLLIASITLDTFQGIFSGVTRGCGWQLFALFANLVTFYFVGLPIAVVLAFIVKIGTKGLWIGLLCGLVCQTTTLVMIAVFLKWERKDFGVFSNEDYVEISEN